MTTDLRINAKGELEGKVTPPAKWEEMYTKDEVVAMLTEIQLEIAEFMGTISPNYDEAAQDISLVIQQKINALGGNENA